MIFQDFARYQMLVGENVGAGDVTRFEDRERWREASDKGMASAFIDSLPQGFETQLGKWFKDGRELSGGLDEPTAAMDAQAEATIFEHFSAMSSQRIVILISHRFSTVRMAEQIVVIQDGRIIEHGNHAQLVAQAGHYAHLFALQAKGYL